MADFLYLNKLDWPIILQMGLETAAFSLTSIAVSWIDTTAIAVYQVMLTISQLGFMVYYGTGAATAVRISNAMGQRDWEAARCNAFAALQIVLIIAVIVSIPIFLFSKQPWRAVHVERRRKPAAGIYGHSVRHLSVWRCLTDNLQ